MDSAREQHPVAAAVAAVIADPEQPFTMLVRFEAFPGQGEGLIAAFAEALRETVREPGCLRYELNRDAARPDQFVLYERWANLRSLEAHLASPHLQRLGPALAPVRAAGPTVDVYTFAGE